VTREELFVVTKIWIDETEDCEAAIKRSLARLDLEYVDLYLIHWSTAVKTVSKDINDTEICESKTGTYERINIPIYKVWA